MAIDIAHFLPLDQFKKSTGTILRQLRAAPKSPGHDRIYTAGEKEVVSEKLVNERGIPINPSLQKELKLIQTELGLDQYQFPF